MMIVFALGISRPLSMMVVESSTSASPLTNLRHDVFQFVAVHLAVADDDPRVAARASAIFAATVWMVDHAVVQKENLSAAIQFALDGVANDALVVLRDDGFDRQPIVRRGFDRAHVARAGQREIKRARNGRGAQREHIHQLAQHLELFLVHHAEALLFVDDDQAEIFERDVVLHQPMRADDNIHRARGQIATTFCCSRRVRKRESNSMRTGIIRHALAKSVEMLLRQNGRRHEDGDLFAAHHGFERRADGDLGFAKADIAANQPVHRLGRFHVLFGFTDGAHLVGRFLVDERAFEFALPRRVRAESVAGLRFARGLDRKQFARDIAHGAFGLLLGFCPTRAAQRVQRRTGFAGADIFADQMRFGDGHVKFRRGLVGIAGRVFDHQAFRSPGTAASAMVASMLVPRADGQDLQARDNARCRAADAPRNRLPPNR